ncbi:uncharacterized protein CLUP02_08286 [Colletotrichum lupini]|uniref:Uncharacterized protein n=1 Tax=Colletotrichum lupini TaxID=145971 RepID=A0A9Q8SU14_9PEZI|nr:uncharacterized protein CLUP02_08286 [Colletotrichum lupini]UQC82796.1 hypothetical protein CLUP02_08286 [Colletotrichum lupini]
MALLAVTTTSQGEPNPTPPSHPILSARSQAVQAKESTGNRDLDNSQAGFSDPRCQNEEEEEEEEEEEALIFASQTP